MDENLEHLGDDANTYYRHGADRGYAWTSLPVPAELADRVCVPQCDRGPQQRTPFCQTRRRETD